jgi:rod shape-determining protein MreB
LFIGERTAEKIKIECGSATDELDNPPENLEIQGRDLLSGKSKQIIIGYREVAKALDKSIVRIEEAVMETLSQTPPELASDIYNSGIYLAGGGALLRGLDQRLSAKTDLSVYISEDPLRVVVRGIGTSLKHLEIYKIVLIQ